jgi:hypothetical protein
MHTRNMWEYQEASVRAYAMDHELSVRTKAAERYLLGELPPEEREAFEEHFFECAECGEEVCIGQELADNVAAVFREQSSPHTTTARKKKRRDWVAWIRPIMMGQAAACLALLALVGYQNAVVIPNLHSGAAASSSPEVVPSAVLVPSSRGALRAVSIPAGAHFFHLALDLGPVQHFKKYACDLRSGSGASMWKLPLATLDPAAGLHLLVPANAFVQGSYVAVLLGISGGETTELVHYYFDVRRP